MPHQLTFDLPVRTARGRDDFYVSASNALALTRLDAPDSWINDRLILAGPEGAGKTHLAHVWADECDALLLTSADLSGLDIPVIAQPVAVDDAHRLNHDAEEPLFHLINHMASRSLPLLLTAVSPPRDWPLVLADLKSRLQASDSARIDPPDDALLQAMLVKLFEDRQLQIDPGLIPWLATQTDRSFAAVQALVAKLDNAALAEKRRITRPLARRVLDNLGKDAR